MDTEPVKSITLPENFRQGIEIKELIADFNSWMEPWGTNEPFAVEKYEAKVGTDGGKVWVSSRRPEWRYRPSLSPAIDRDDKSFMLSMTLNQDGEGTPLWDSRSYEIQGDRVDRLVGVVEGARSYMMLYKDKKGREVMRRFTPKREIDSVGTGKE